MHPLKVPIYKQLRDDNSCGPQVILMVADYFSDARGRKLYAHEWSEVLKVTMSNDLAGDDGTSWGGLREGLRMIGLGSKKIKGGLSSLRSALGKGLPVIVNCTIPYKKRKVRHYAVLVGMDESTLLIADPFPHKPTRKDGLREVPSNEFKCKNWSEGQVVWGDPRWAIEVFYMEGEKGSQIDVQGRKMIGPYTAQEILLCSADAGPGSQRKQPGEAGHFFPGGKWVGAVRNSAKRKNCDFLILTTEHGFVSSEKIISPYDFHIDIDPARANNIWKNSFNQAVRDHKYKLMIFYGGGCPREPYIELIRPLCHLKKIDILTFGRPNMYDVGKMDRVIEKIFSGTTVDELKSIMKIPERLDHYSLR